VLFVNTFYKILCFLAATGRQSKKRTDVYKLFNVVDGFRGF